MDIFACAARPSEIHRYLIGQQATLKDVMDRLEDGSLSKYLGSKEGLYFLKGKEHLWARRVRFLEHSRRGWKRARLIAEKIQKMGLASAGLVTGSLAAENCDEHADIDFLFIYPSKRTWLSFGVVRVLGKVPKLGLESMCPNYALPDDHLEIQPQNLFTAWEIAKAVPLFGHDVYHDFINANRWVRQYLPNALPDLDLSSTNLSTESSHSVLEKLTDTRAFRWLENSERRRKWSRDERDVGVNLDARFQEGSVDRHSPTRPFQTLSELRYRMDLFGLNTHPLYSDIQNAGVTLETEMGYWGKSELDSSTRSATTQNQQQE